MMERLCSTPPHTLGLVSPACRATSTYWTGDVAAATSAFFHFQRGVVRASVSVLPSRKRDDPRKRRRGKVMACDDYRRARLPKIFQRLLGGWGPRVYLEALLHNFPA